MVDGHAVVGRKRSTDAEVSRPLEHGDSYCSTYTYTAPTPLTGGGAVLSPKSTGRVQLLSFWFPLIPVAQLSSQTAPTTSVSPATATAPNPSKASVLDAFT